MRSVSKKVAIIIILIILIIGICGGVFAYLFLATDTFKSEKELFFNYLTQNVETIKEIANSKTLENYNNLKNGQTYEENTTANIKYAEGGEISSPYNNLSMTLKNQKDTDYNYKDFNIILEEQSAVQIEGIQNSGNYGIRFSNLLRQFVSLENGQKIDGLEIEDEKLEALNAIIVDDSTYFQDMIFSKQELQSLESKYITVISQILSQGSFSKQSKSTITVGSQSIQTTAYSVDLTGYQFQNLIIEILNNLKIDDTIIGKIEAISGSSENYVNTIDSKIRQVEDKDFKAVKIVVYEKGGVTQRTEMQSEDFNVIMDISIQNGNGNITFEYTSLNSENNSKTLNISKQLTDTKENYAITFNVANGEEEYEINATLDSDFARTNLSFGYKKGITEITISLENNISTSIGEKIELTSENNVILNELSEESLSATLNVLNVQVPEKLKGRYELLIQKLQATELINEIKNKYNVIFGAEVVEEEQPQENGDNLTGEETPSSEADDLTKTEINRFNAMFQFYSGTGISGANVKQMVELSKDYLESVNIEPIEGENNKEKITLNIKLGSANVELANSIIERIDEQKKYEVSMTFNETNGILETITITQINS